MLSHRICAGLTGLALTAAAGLSGAEGADFYKGKRLSIVASAGPGGGFDLYARLLGRHIAKYIPGNPGVINQNRTGASGIVLANYTYDIAPKDGTFIGNIRSSALKDSILGNKRTKFDGKKFEYIGNLNAETSSCVFWHTSGVNSVEDFFAKEIVMGGSGRGGESYSYPKLANALLGTKFKIILGYRASGLRLLAMERGEIQGECGSYTSILKFQRAKDLKEGRLRVLMIASNKPDPDFADKPNLLDLAKDPEKRKVLSFMLTPLEIARMFASPPGTPKDRVAILRTAFDAAVKDPAFKEDAKRGKLTLNTSSAAEVEAVVARLYSATPDLVKRVKAALAGKVAKRKLVYYTHTAKIAKVKRNGSRIYFKDRDGRNIQASVGGKETKITIGGKKAKKTAIKPGLTCKIHFAGPYSNAKSLDCT
ncbi:MAG: tripartite tricarboxylate transporter substrate-binding protein [Alphaproteobacteria bacterium]|nr:tripartite tricarboxylate transporter substrate-binding protein [Alphaproteobacteria bacterium]